TQLIWTHHHLLLDGWSVVRLLQEVLVCYEAERQGRSLVQEKRRPYRDYISWLTKHSSEAAQTYWQHTLTGITAPTPLPMGRNGEHAPSRGNGPEQTYAEVVLPIEALTAQRWREYAKLQHVTLYILVEAAWALVLSRYSGQSDVVFGTVVAGRPPELTGV